MSCLPEFHPPTRLSLRGLRSWSVSASEMISPRSYCSPRTMCFAEIIAPEAFMNTELKLKTIADVTNDLKEELGLPQGDDGSGIWVILTEVPRGHWGAAGRTLPLAELIDVMGGEVSEPRRAEMKAHFDGYDKMKSTFKIPS